MQPGREPIREDSIDDFEDTVVGMAQRRFVIADYERRFRVEFHLHPPLPPLLRFHRHPRGRRGRRGDLPKRLLDQGDHILGVEIADQCNGGAIRPVIGLEERLRFRRCERQDIRLPPDRRHAVPVCPKGRRGKCFKQQSARTVVVAQPAFFHHDTPLFVELAKDRLSHAVGFDRRPQWKTIGRQADRVACEIFAGGCVKPDAPVPLVE